MAFLNAALLLGLVAALIPLVVHLFKRRRVDTVDWAAMQFLRLVPTTRRRIVWEQVLLMMLRSSILAVLALALAAPTINLVWVSRLSAPDKRDFVFVLDGSASMAYRPPSPAADTAKNWITEALNRLATGDRAAIIQARQRPVLITPILSTNHGQSANSVALTSAPAGSADWSTALQTALGLLDAGQTNRHVVVVTDNQRFGWADEVSLNRWDLFHKSTNRDDPTAPRIWVVNVAADRPTDLSNRTLDPITPSRKVAVAGREVAFRSALRTMGTPSPLPRIHLEIDGRPIRELTPEVDGQTLRFTHKFAAGSHVVTLRMGPDDLPADNRQDFALEVLPVIPVLIVDGAGTRGSGETEGGSVFLADALAPPRDTSPAFAVRTVSIAAFRPGLLSQDVKGPGTLPRVVILANLPRLTTEQQIAIERYLADGGSVLVTLGERCDPAVWNRVAYRGGQGFLPARIVEPIDGKARPDLQSFHLPVTEVFREPLPGGLHTALFPHYWKLDPTAGVNGPTGEAIAKWTTGDPFLIERSFGAGRVILSAVPLDDSWETNLPRLPDFVRLAHELMYHLAGARGTEWNLDATQAIVFTPNPYEPPGPLTVLGPDGRSRSVAVTGWPAIMDGPHDPGAYRLTTPAGRTHFVAVQPDPRESVLTPCSEEDQQKIAATIGKLRYITSMDEITDEPNPTGGQEVWWVLMLVMVGMLGLEVWYTRRLSVQE